MNWPLLGPLLLTAALAITSWVVVHFLAAKRDRANKRRDLIIQYLITAYRQLEACSNRTEMFDIKSLESPIADIQLLGSAKQVELAQEFARQFGASTISKGASVDELLRVLREDLRAELLLDPVPKTVLFLRI